MALMSFTQVQACRRLVNTSTLTSQGDTGVDPTQLTQMMDHDGNATLVLLSPGCDVKTNIVA